MSDRCLTAKILEEAVSTPTPADISGGVRGPAGGPGAWTWGTRGSAFDSQGCQLWVQWQEWAVEDTSPKPE